MAYSQDMWRDFLRDFIIEVVRRPVLIVGNSIGGFMAASLAGDYPALAEGELRGLRIQHMGLCHLAPVPGMGHCRQQRSLLPSWDHRSKHIYGFSSGQPRESVHGCGPPLVLNPAMLGQVRGAAYSYCPSSAAGPATVSVSKGRSLFFLQGHVLL